MHEVKLFFYWNYLCFLFLFLAWAISDPAFHFQGGEREKNGGQFPPSSAPNESHCPLILPSWLCAEYTSEIQAIDQPSDLLRHPYLGAILL